MIAAGQTNPYLLGIKPIITGRQLNQLESVPYQGQFGTLPSTATTNALAPTSIAEALPQAPQAPELPPTPPPLSPEQIGQLPSFLPSEGFQPASLQLKPLSSLLADIPGLMNQLGFSQDLSQQIQAITQQQQQGFSQSALPLFQQQTEETARRLGARGIIGATQDEPLRRLAEAQAGQLTQGLSEISLQGQRDQIAELQRQGQLKSSVALNLLGALDKRETVQALSNQEAVITQQANNLALGGYYQQSEDLKLKAQDVQDRRIFNQFSAKMQTFAAELDRAGLLSDLDQVEFQQFMQEFESGLSLANLESLDPGTRRRIIGNLITEYEAFKKDVPAFSSMPSLEEQSILSLLDGNIGGFNF